MSQPSADSLVSSGLLEQVRQGNAGAIEQILALNRSYLHRLVSLRLDPRLRRRVDASDVVQDAQVEAARRLPAYLEAPVMPLRLWLRQIAYDRLIMLTRRHLNANRRSVMRELSLPEEPSACLGRQLAASAGSPSEHFVRHELARRVRETMAFLSEADREILLMRNFESLTNQEVSQVLGIDPAAASKRYGRALIRLRSLLKKDGGASA